MFTKKKNTPSNSHRRVYFALTLIFCLTRLLLVAYIIFNYTRAALSGWAQGLQTYQRQNNQNPERGEIFFAGGEPLAINKPFDYVYASPIKISNKSDTAQKLAEILNLNANDIEKN